MRMVALAFLGPLRRGRGLHAGSELLPKDIFSMKHQTVQMQSCAGLRVALHDFAS